MGSDRLGKITKDNAALILIDIQERFIPHIHDVNVLVEKSVKLVKVLTDLGVPTIITEQYPEGLGRTVGMLRVALQEFSPFEKEAFSIFDDQAIAAEIEKLNRPNLLIGGIEAHVCVIKSALDAIEKGYNVHWISDAVSSRSENNAVTATRRAIQCGAYASCTEMIMFQLMKSKNDPAFREISKIIR